MEVKAKATNTKVFFRKINIFCLLYQFDAVFKNAMRLYLLLFTIMLIAGSPLPGVTKVLCREIFCGLD